MSTLEIHGLLTQQIVKSTLHHGFLVLSNTKPWFQALHFVANAEKGGLGTERWVKQKHSVTSQSWHDHGLYWYHTGRCAAALRRACCEAKRKEDTARICNHEGVALWPYATDNFSFLFLWSMKSLHSSVPRCSKKHDKRKWRVQLSNCNFLAVRKASRPLHMHRSLPECKENKEHWNWVECWVVLNFEMCWVRHLHSGVHARTNVLESSRSFGFYSKKNKDVSFLLWTAVMQWGNEWGRSLAVVGGWNTIGFTFACFHRFRIIPADLYIVPSEDQTWIFFHSQ